jgi:hypothetical protein
VEEKCGVVCKRENWQESAEDGKCPSLGEPLIFRKG